MRSLCSWRFPFAAGGQDAAANDDRPTIRLITDATGIDDKSFNAAAWRGILSFYGDTWDNQKSRGVKYDVVTCQTQDRYIPTLKQASDEGYDLICVTGFTFADALGEVAPLYPDQKYMIVDVDWVALPNVMQFTFAEHEGSYLVGVIAALKAKADGIKNLIWLYRRCSRRGYHQIRSRVRTGYSFRNSRSRDRRLLCERLGQARTGKSPGQKLV